MTVSELNAEIRSVLESAFGSVWVEGEIKNFVAHSSGHWYFSLTDGDTFLKAACYKSQNFRIRFSPSDGLHVRCRGRVSAYAPRGEYQLLVDSMEPVGEGALALAFEQIKARLFAEGLFDAALKRRIPYFPARVGIITSPDGAAIHDIMTVLDRRARSVSVVMVPALVQGEYAAGQLVAAILMANEFSESCPPERRIDVLIVGRGGGSAEDLWAFNEESVARAIRASRIPVISAVGHEVDFTIADLAADVRAATPSAAAEMVAESEAEIRRRIDRCAAELVRRMQFIVLSSRSDLQELENSAVFTDVPARVREIGHKVDALGRAVFERFSSRVASARSRLASFALRLSPESMRSKVGRDRARLSMAGQRSVVALERVDERDNRRLETVMARLDALSPLSVLSRGYSITQKKGGEIVRSVHQITAGELIDVRLGEGSIEAEVRRIREETLPDRR